MAGFQERLFPEQRRVIELCRSGVPTPEVAEQTFYSVVRVRSLAREAGVAGPSGRPKKDRGQILFFLKNAKEQGYPASWVARKAGCGERTVYRVQSECGGRERIG